MFVNFGVILNDMIDLRLNQYVLIRKRTFIKTNWFTVHVLCNIHVHANHSSIFNRFGYIHANLSDLQCSSKEIKIHVYTKSVFQSILQYGQKEYIYTSWNHKLNGNLHYSYLSNISVQMMPTKYKSFYMYTVHMTVMY